MYKRQHYNIARTLLAQGHAGEAAEQYRAALALRPDWTPVIVEAAWLFATHPDARVRDPALAISLAERGAALTNRRDPVLLDVLAAAYAASGGFEQAIAAARAARDLIPNESVVEQRLALYQQRRAFLDVLGSGPIKRTND